jgi:hypothetical protein
MKKKITIEISEDLLIDLKAWNKADNWGTARFNKANGKNFPMFTIRQFIANEIRLAAENKGLIDEEWDVYEKELKKLRAARVKKQ